MEAIPTLGMRVRFPDGSHGQIIALRRAFVDGDVRVQIVAGPDEGTQVLIDGELTPNWIDVTAVTLLVPIDRDAALVQAQGEIAEAKLALLRTQIADRMAAIGDTTDPVDVVLRSLLDLLPVVRDLNVPPIVINGFVQAAHTLIRAVAPSVAAVLP